MTDSPIQQFSQWLEWYIQQYGPPQKDPSAVGRLMRAIADYLNWMKSVNYSLGTQYRHQIQLTDFIQLR